MCSIPSAIRWICVRAPLNWQLGGLSANLYYNYVDGYRNTAITPNVDVDSYHTIDLALIYDFGGESECLGRLQRRTERPGHHR